MSCDYRRCHHCASLWMDPCPTRESVPRLYRSYYTHREPAAPFEAPHGVRLSVLRRDIRRALLARYFGYRSQSGIGGVLARCIAGIISWTGLGREIVGRDIRYVPHAGATLLDVGCGNGEYLLRMSRLGWIVTGIEPDSGSAAIARRHGVIVHECGIEEIAPDIGRFDVITMSHVIEHLVDPSAEFARLLGMLNPGGMLVVLSPNPLGSIARRFRASWMQLDPPRHLVLPSAAAYRAMLAQSGVRGRVFTCLRGAPGVMQESLSIRQYGIVGRRRGWAFAKAIAYIVLPALSWVLPDRGEEIVCIAHAQSRA